MNPYNDQITTVTFEMSESEKQLFIKLTKWNVWTILGLVCPLTVIVCSFVQSCLTSNQFKTCTQHMHTQRTQCSTWHKAMWERIIELIFLFRFPFSHLSNPVWPRNSKPCPAVQTCWRFKLVYEVRSVDHGIPFSVFKLLDLTLHEGHTERFYTCRLTVLLKRDIVHVYDIILNIYFRGLLTKVTCGI